ncbi:MAG: hypothetical protein P4M14_01925 [Gammaproteobacteria bacterium]|nr:hypothetical protein [Gammaproteobacteria bacterium]
MSIADKYMIDTNIFSQITEGKLSLEMLPINSCLYVTYIQWQEIIATKNVAKREAILNNYKIINASRLATDTFLAGVSSVGTAGVGNGLLQKNILQMLNKKKLKFSNIHSAVSKADFIS